MNQLFHTYLAAHGAKCNAQCAAEIGRLVGYIYRVVYHYWGFSGVMKVTGGAITAYGFGRLAWLVSRPLQYFSGTIRLEGDHYVIHPYRVGTRY